MFLTELSIKRPVIATVMSLVLVLFGVFTFNKIPLRELPDIDTAKINIRTDYDGASAKIIDKQITQKIEERIGGTPGVISIDSISEDGRSSITLEFDLGIDLDVAANDVRDRLRELAMNCQTKPSHHKFINPQQIDVQLCGLHSKVVECQI